MEEKPYPIKIAEHTIEVNGRDMSIVSSTETAIIVGRPTEPVMAECAPSEDAMILGASCFATSSKQRLNLFLATMTVAIGRIGPSAFADPFDPVLPSKSAALRPTAYRGKWKKAR